MLGPKKACVLYEELGISSVEELADTIHEERLRDLKGFEPKTEENILHGIELLQSSGERVLLDVAMNLADDIVTELSRATGCRRCTYAGSLRRFRETIGDIDVLAAAGMSAPVMRAFTDVHPPIDADLDAVFAACARTGTTLEINAHPDRLDLRDEDILRP